MPHLTSVDQLVLCFGLGVAAFGTGVLHAALPRMRRLWLNAIVLGLFLGTAGLAAALSLVAAVVVSGAGLLWMLFSIMSSPGVRKRFARFTWPALPPRVGWAVFAAVGLLLGLGAVVHEDWRENAETDEIRDRVKLLTYRPPLAPDVQVKARTDQQTSVPVLKAINHRPPEDALAQEQEYLLNNGWYRRVISRIPPCDDCNCHGWVFTGGRYWVTNRTAATILAENHYQVVDDPRPGDLAVYFDDTGDVIHTAIVRGSVGDTVMVESKWAALGVYLHGVFDSMYGTDVHFYRSERDGHVIQGLDESDPP